MPAGQRLPIQVCVHLFRRSGNPWQTLLLRRSVPRGNFWQGISGGVEPGESIQDAAARETREETGLKPVPLLDARFSFTYPIPETSTSLYCSTEKVITEHVFSGVVGRDVEPVLSDEHIHYEWTTVAVALERLVMFPTQALAFTRSVEALKRAIEE